MTGFAGRSDFVEEEFCVEDSLAGSVNLVESNLVGEKLAYYTNKKGMELTELRLCH